MMKTIGYLLSTMALLVPPLAGAAPVSEPEDKRQAVQSCERVATALKARPGGKKVDEAVTPPKTEQCKETTFSSALWSCIEKHVQKGDRYESALDVCNPEL